MTPMEAPRREDLDGLHMDVIEHEEPWVITVRTVAQDGSVLEVTWDEISARVSVRWLLNSGIDCLTIERESVKRVGIQQTTAGMRFEVATATEHLEGGLTLDVGASIYVKDVLLRR